MDIKDISLDQIYNFIQNGDRANAPKDIVDYLSAMEKVRGMHLRRMEFGTRTLILNHLVKVDGLSDYLANKLYNQTVEYFYCESGITKKAWRNLYADRLDDLAALAEQLIKDPRDAKAVAGIYVEAAEMRGLDEVDAPEIPKAAFERPWKLYAMDPVAVGLAPINRNRLAEIIDQIPDLSERQKDRLKEDAAIHPIKVFPNEQEDIRKQ